MHDRGFALVAASAIIVCWGGSTVVAGLVGDVVLVAVRQFAAVAEVGLGVAVLTTRKLEFRPVDSALSAPLKTTNRWTRVQGIPR